MRGGEPGGPRAGVRAVVVLALAAALLALAGCAATAASGTDPAPVTSPGKERVTVLAAASLHAAFEEIAADFEADHPGSDVMASYDGSNALVDQLAGGARADVLATADEASMARAVEAGLAQPDPRTFASNHLVLVAPPGNPGHLTGLDPSLAGAKVVVCAPAVPCGRATLALAGRAGVRLAPVSEESSVTDVLGKVTSGEADAGIVYATDAVAAGDRVDTLPIAGADESPNHYPISPTTTARNPEAARAFVDHVLGAGGQGVLARHGFAPAR